MSDRQRLERLCKRMHDRWMADAECGEERGIIVMVSDDAEGLHLYGYPEGAEYDAVVDMLRMAKLACDRLGIEFNVVAVGETDARYN